MHLARHTEVEVIDNDGGRIRWLALVRRLRDRRRHGWHVIATSPHWALPLAVAASKARGAHVMHGPLIYMASRTTRPLFVSYYRLVTRALRIVIVHGERFIPVVQELRLRERSVIAVPHGFVPGGFLGDAPYDPGGPLVCIGRLLPYKGVDVFVAALRMLADRGMPAPAVIGGEGVGAELVPDGVPRLELVPGHVSDEEYAAIIDRCSAVVLPYREATQSGVLAHAFAAGRPVIATDVGALPEYVDETNGYLVPPGDAAALAEAIATHVGDAERARELAAGARLTWERRLDPDTAAREILDALER